MTKKKTVRRATFLCVLFCLVSLMFIGVSAAYQLFSEDSGSSASVTTYSVTVSASRGEIYDRNGIVLAASEQTNSIIFNAAEFPSSSENELRNTVIYNLIVLFEEYDTEWTDNLPIYLDEDGNPQFEDGRDADITALKSSYMLNVNSYATAQNCMDVLIEMYELEDYSLEYARKIASVRYEMWRTGYSLSQSYTFAEDVSSELVSIILENSSKFPGVETEVSATRVYTQGDLASHILGVVGSISSSEYEAAQEELEEALSDTTLSETELTILEINAYTVTDLIGKFGIESAMEDYLRGTNGLKTVTIDSDGNITEEYEIEPEQGNNVILTIDANLQAVAQEALESRILELTASEGLEAAGAVIVMNVNTGEILASASYPTFDLSTYYEDYNDLVSDSASPLWNRVLQSTYEPGSTMKPAIAAAALETGAITESTTFYCDGEFEYLEQVFECLSSHGSINVVTALEKSCNIFFYNVADIIGIDVMNEYCSLFGLGQKTGVELTESTGILAGKTYRESIGSYWYAGDTIQAAIGQSDNQFTLIQLCNYCATIANNGTRYVPYYIKSVVSSDFSEVIYEAEPTVAVETGISQSTIDIIKEGMLAVTTTGSTASYFSSLSESVAAKTGTSQTAKVVNGVTVEGNNGFIISFGPYENPEIAIAVVIENVDSGSAVAKVAADIYEYYFSSGSSLGSPEEINVLLDMFS